METEVGPIRPHDAPARARDRRRLLVIGGPAEFDAVRRALPGCDVQSTDRPIEGVWRGGQGEIDGAYISLSLGPSAFRTIRSLRSLSNDVTIVVGCHPAEEPLARRALDEGADDYVVEPLEREELEQAFHVHAPRVLPPLRAAAGAGETPPESTAALPELAQLSQVIRSMDTGAAAILDRLAESVQSAFDTVGVAIEIDGVAATAGDASDPILSEEIHRAGQVVGRIALGRCRRGTHVAGAVRRLAEYADLIEALISEARKRDRLRNLAWCDDLTGLRNRRYFEQVLDDLINGAVRKRQNISLVLLEIQDFAQIAEQRGREAADQVLLDFAQLLMRCSREADIVARLAESLFALVLWDAEPKRTAGSEHPRNPLVLKERFLRAIGEDGFATLGGPDGLRIRIVAALVAFPWMALTRDALIHAAEAELAEAKRSGENTIELPGRALPGSGLRESA